MSRREKRALTGRTNLGARPDSMQRSTQLITEIGKLKDQRDALNCYSTPQGLSGLELRTEASNKKKKVKPTFGTLLGGGANVIGRCALQHPMPKTVPQWGWKTAPIEFPSRPRCDNFIFSDGMSRHSGLTNKKFDTAVPDLPIDRNQWSMAQRSMKDPLRSLLLDDSMRNIPRHKLQSELRAARRQTNLPHTSFDLDGDGCVSPLDLKYSKAYDVNADGLLSKPELKDLRLAMTKDLISKKKTVCNLSQTPINRAQYDKEVAQLAGSPNFVADFASAYNRQNLQNMGSSNGLINVTSHHHEYKQSRLHALQPPHNATNVVRNGMLISSPRSGKQRRCQSRSELLKERRREYHDDALKLGFKDDGKTSLFRRMTDSTIGPVQM